MSKHGGDISVLTVGGSNFEFVAGNRRLTVGRLSPGEAEITPTSNLLEAHSSRDGGQRNVDSSGVVTRSTSVDGTYLETNRVITGVKRNSDRQASNVVSLSVSGASTVDALLQFVSAGSRDSIMSQSHTSLILVDYS